MLLPGILRKAGFWVVSSRRKPVRLIAGPALRGYRRPRAIYGAGGLRTATSSFSNTATGSRPTFFARIFPSRPMM